MTQPLHNQTSISLTHRHSKLQDGPGEWDPQHISRSLIAAFAPSHAKTQTNKPAAAEVDVIVTFDKHGVSGHSNHIACHHGAVAFQAELTRGRPGWESPVTVYALSTISTLRKLNHLLDAVPTFAQSLFRMASRGGGGGVDTAGSKKGGSARGVDQQSVSPCPGVLLHVSGVGDWNRAQRAMISGHWSQMVWFRWFWIGLGRYLVINDLRRVPKSEALAEPNVKKRR